VNAELFVRGLAIGFAVAFALGPIGLIVIRRTVARGWAYGLVSGVGVATADSLYAAVAAFGLTAVSLALVGIDRLLGIIGGTVLMLLAFRSLRSVLAAGDGRARGEPGGSPVADPGILVADPGPDRAGGRPGAWASMVGLTLMNPATILSFAALFASIGAGTGGSAGAAAVVAGVFAGSVAWWALLTGLVAGLRTRVTPWGVRTLNAASAVVIGGFGIVAICLGIAG
jgi:putative LysE/RhtB family amino acid efflux pump